MHDINCSFGKGSVTRLGSAGGALVYVTYFGVTFTSFNLLKIMFDTCSNLCERINYVGKCPTHEYVGAHR